MGRLQDEIYTLAAVLLAVILAVPTAHAKIFMTGQSGLPAKLMLGGSLQDTTSGTTTVPTFVSFTERLYADANNAFCVNCLDFVYRFTDGPGVNEGSNNITNDDMIAQLVIETDTLQDGAGYVTAKDESADFTQSLAPLAVPETATLGMLGAGLLLAGRFIVRRKVPR
jgi:hypothetical protein